MGGRALRWPRAAVAARCGGRAGSCKTCQWSQNGASVAPLACGSCRTCQGPRKGARVAGSAGRPGGRSGAAGPWLTRWRGRTIRLRPRPVSGSRSGCASARGRSAARDQDARAGGGGAPVRSGRAQPPQGRERSRSPAGRAVGGAESGPAGKAHWHSRQPSATKNLESASIRAIFAVGTLVGRVPSSHRHHPLPTGGCIT